MRAKFHVVAARGSASSTRNTFSLIRDNWDDFRYRTLFQLWYTDESGTPIEIGAVKIGRVGMGDERGSTTFTKDTFFNLDAKYFSLGQDREYYLNLSRLKADVGISALHALQDISVDLSRLPELVKERVMEVSLLRQVDQEVIRNQFHWIALGHAPRTSYKFSYVPPRLSGSSAARIVFDVKVDSFPPTNTHVLIGANGVGKSTLMRNLALSLRSDSDARESGQFVTHGVDSDRGRRVPFDGVLAISFSAFDSFAQAPASLVTQVDEVPYRAIGLTDWDHPQTKDARIERQFARALRACVRNPRKQRWLDALEILKIADPVLRDLTPEMLLENDLTDDEVSGAAEYFHALSSGHKIVLLTLTSLVTYVEERTLILFDEPETHLHPPLLSALIRATNAICLERNGVAIVATHSPVVLQDVPGACVTVIHRSGDLMSVSDPRIETYGESVSVLTAEVFGLNVTDTGYGMGIGHALKRADVPVIENLIGSEGRSVLRALEDDEEEPDIL